MTLMRRENYRVILLDYNDSYKMNKADIVHYLFIEYIYNCKHKIAKTKAIKIHKFLKSHK